MIKLTKRALHTPEAELFGAFDNREQLTFYLTADREDGVADPRLELYRDDDGAQLSLPFTWQEPTSEHAHDKYTLRLNLADLWLGEDGLFWYTVVYDSPQGKRRLSCDPCAYAHKEMPADWGHIAFQLTVYRPEGEAPKRQAGGVMYHIFVDRFCKGSREVPCREDALAAADWDHDLPQFAEYPGGYVENNLFFGGTLWGVAEKLDYLASLGVTILYLSPIFEAYSNHKYDTGDYMKVDDMFGGEEAFEHLLEEAKKRGIDIILDGVFNHTGADSRYFNKKGRYESVGAYQSPDSPYRDWFEFYEYPDRYRCWWGIDILPAVTTTNPAYTEYICGENGVAAHYLKKGIAGWRLDVADELNMSFLEALRAAIKAVDKDALLYGEVWEDASYKEAYGTRRRYFRGAQLDSVMNYPLKNGVIHYVKTGDSKPLFEASAGLYRHYPKATSDLLMNFLGTHDTERVLTVLGGVEAGDRPASQLATLRMSESERESAIALLKLAFLLVSTLPGIPCIYYGDEAGVEGYRDPFNRMPYPWGREDKALTEHYRTLGRIRAEHRALFGEGYFKVIEDLPYGVFAFERWNSDERIMVVVNRSGEPFTLPKAGKDLLTCKCVKTVEPDSAVIIEE